MTEQLANSAQSTLNGGIDNIVTSLVVTAGTSFPSSGNFRVIIDSEIIIVGARSGTTLSSLTRGAEGTTAASHSNGATVTHDLTKGGLDAYLTPDHIGTGTPSASNFWRGDGPWSLVPNLIGLQVLTGSGTYTPTAGTTKIFVECVGGGGGGGGCGAAASNAGGAGGGGGGAYAASLITSGFSGVSYAVGAGGNGGSAGTNNGFSGADTTFNSTTVVAKAGLLGTGAGNNTAAAGGAGGAASGSTGNVKMDGSRGGNGFIANSNGAIGGNGGAAPRGGGGVPGMQGATGTAGAFAGGGGGGAGGVSSLAGGAGAAGTIIVWEFT